MKHRFKARGAHKYGAKRTNIDNINFDSQKEAKYYLKLKDMQRKGEILWFIRQVPFDLPAGIRHRVDFMVVYPEEVKFVEVKGRDLQTGKNMRFMVEDLYGIEIEVV